MSTINFIDEFPIGKTTFAHTTHKKEKVNFASCMHALKFVEPITIGGTYDKVYANIEKVELVFESTRSVRNRQSTDAEDLRMQSEMSLRKSGIIDPIYATAYERLAAAAWKLEDANISEHYLKMAIRLNPTSAPAHGRLGQVLMKKGEQPKAIEHFQIAIQLDPEDDFAYGRLGMLYTLDNRNIEAEHYLRLAVSTNPNDATNQAVFGGVLLQNREWQQAEWHLRKALDLDPTHAIAHTLLGDLLIRKNQLAEARLHLDTAIKISPKSALPHKRRAALCIIQGRVSDAIEALKSVLSINADDAFSKGALSFISHKTGTQNRAEDSLVMAIERDPCDVFSYMVLIELYKRKKDWVTAESYYRKALVLVPRNGFLYEKFGNFLIATQQYDEAKIYFQRLHTAFPTDDSIRITLNSIDKLQLDYAIENLRNELRYCPNDGYMNGLLGDLLRQKNEPDEAWRCLFKATTEAPNDAFSRGRFGDVLLMRGSLDLAEEYLKQAIELDINDAFAHGRLGSLLKTRGKMEEAKRHLERAHELNPSDSYVTALLCKA